GGLTAVDTVLSVHMNPDKIKTLIEAPLEELPAYGPRGLSLPTIEDIECATEDLDFLKARPSNSREGIGSAWRARDPDLLDFK
ncbi:unnamed protein product, partial [Prorocentrum cordatum]